MSEVKSKSDLAAMVAEKTSMTKADAGAAVDAVIEGITEVMQSGAALNIVGFGKFESVAKPERQGRNPSTGEALTIAAKNSPKFTAGKGLKDNINKG